MDRLISCGDAVERLWAFLDQQRSYRWTFLVSGLEHPNFARIVEQITPAGEAKISAAATALAA